MKLSILSLVFIATCIGAKAQEFNPDWYVLEPGASVGIVKAGINDLMLFTATNQKAVDRNSIQELNNHVNYSAGDAVVLYAKVKDAYMGTDIEGRTILVKGNVTPAEHLKGSGVAYMKADYTANGITLHGREYVWVTKAGQATVLVQAAGKKSVDVPKDKVYMIDETTEEMMPTISFKNIGN